MYWKNCSLIYFLNIKTQESFARLSHPYLSHLIKIKYKILRKCACIASAVFISALYIQMQSEAEE